MKVVLTNTTAAEIKVELPDGGRVPANSTAEFAGVTNDILELALINGLADDLSSGDLTMAIEAEALDGGGNRVFTRNFTVTHEDLTAEALTETVEDTETLPARARLIGYYHNVGELFSGGAVSACSIDVGISATKADILTDGTDVFTGADTGEAFGSGTNAAGFQPQDLGGEKLRVLFTAVGANVDALTAGSVTMTALYAVL